MNTDNNASLVEIYKPGNQNEVAQIKILLDRDGIVYYINNENYSSLVPLFATGARTMSLMVQSDRAEEARTLLKTELGLMLNDKK